MVIAAGEFLLCLHLILYWLVDPRATCCALDVQRIQITHVSLIQCYLILMRISFWRLKDAFARNLWMVEFVIKMLAPIVIEVLLPSWDFRREVFGLTVVPSSVWQVILLVERTSLVVSELVISHNKFIRTAMRIIINLLTDT